MHYTIYVDADSCPRQLRTIILKAVKNRGVRALFVADRPLSDVLELENSLQELVTMLVIESGDDATDDVLVKMAISGSIAITRDIPLASRLVEKGVVVLDDRGNTYTKENIQERLSIRNVMSELRDYGLFVEQTKPLGPKEIKLFANALDRQLTQRLKD